MFLVAACTNKTLVDSTSAQQVARERRLWDEIVRRERSMVDALIAERRRRDDLQAGRAHVEGGWWCVAQRCFVWYRVAELVGESFFRRRSWVQGRTWEVSTWASDLSEAALPGGSYSISE